MNMKGSKLISLIPDEPIEFEDISVDELREEASQLGYDPVEYERKVISFISDLKSKYQ